MPHRLLTLGLWGAALCCWGWLYAGSRSRSRLLRNLGTRYGGFVRTKFSIATLTVEASELSFVQMFGPRPYHFRFRYEITFFGGGGPCTVMEFELPSAALGPEPGLYTPADHRSGRGLFLAGTNLTGHYTRFVGELPEGVHPRLAWQGAVVRLVMPGLLGAQEEIWVLRCFEFLSEVATQLAGSGTR